MCKSLKLKFQTVAEKTAKNFRGLLYFAAPGIFKCNTRSSGGFVTSIMQKANRNLAQVVYSAT